LVDHTTLKAANGLKVLTVWHGLARHLLWQCLSILCLSVRLTHSRIMP